MGARFMNLYWEATVLPKFSSIQVMHIAVENEWFLRPVCNQNGCASNCDIVTVGEEIIASKALGTS